MADGQIAAIAAVHGFTVATRDPAPFVAAGWTPVEMVVLNPEKASMAFASQTTRQLP